MNTIFDFGLHNLVTMCFMLVPTLLSPLFEKLVIHKINGIKDHLYENSKFVVSSIKTNFDLAIFMYTTKICRLSALFLPPVLTVIFVQLNNKMYDYDKLTVTDSIYFLMTNVLMAVCMNTISGIFTWYLTDYRMKELIYELEELKLKLGVFIPTCNKTRINKAIKNVWKITNVYFIPINLYKSVISIMGSLMMINGFHFKMCLIGIYTVVIIILHLFSKYVDTSKVDDVVFDPKSKEGYIEEKTKEELNPLNITSIENTSEVCSRLTLGHILTNDIDSKMENETKRCIKNAFKNTLVDTAGAVIFIFLLNVSSRSVAQSASSLCWIISMAVDSFHKWKKIYYLQEHAHILSKLKQYKHECSDILDSQILKPDHIVFNDVSFGYNRDILIDLEMTSELAISNLTCMFKKGKLNYITGENGGGKSSLFKALLHNINSGCIKFDQIDRKSISWLTLRRSIYYLCQINENPTILQKDTLNILKEKEPKLAEQFGLLSIENIAGDSQGGSGGQEQRIHVFTALASGASIVLLDEPFSAFDISWKSIVEDILIEQSRDKIIIMIGHDCFKEKKHMINTYVINSYKKSPNGNTELTLVDACDGV